MKLLLACVGFMWLVSLGIAAGIREGMSRAQVEAELGPPMSFLAGGNKTILTYPNGGRVELIADQVTALTRVQRFDEGAAATAADAAKAEPAGRAEQDVEASEEDAKWTEEDTDAIKQLEDTVADMIDQAPGGVAEDYGLAESASFFWPYLGAAMLVQFIVGIVILKMAFAWTDVHADWSQMLLPSLAAALSGAIVKAIAFTLWDALDVFHLDNAISYGVLLFTLLKTTHACTWQRAAGVAMATKLMSLVVWVFLGVALTNVVFA